MVATGQKLGASRGTHWLHVESRELGTFLGELIKVRCLNRGVSVHAQITPALIVCQHY